MSKVHAYDKLLNQDKSQRKKEPPSQSIIAFRSNPTDASTVLEFLTDVFSKPEPSVVLNKLHGTELTSILQSLGLPGLNGKAKSKQVENIMLLGKAGVLFFLRRYVEFTYLH